MRFESDRDIVLHELGNLLRTLDPESLERARRLAGAAERTFFLGAGRSALALRMVAMRWMHLGQTSFVVGDVTTPAVAAGDLLIVASASGRTATVVNGVEIARRVRANVLAITTDPASPVAKGADEVLVLTAGNKRDQGSPHSEQYAGSLFEQATLLLFDILFHGLWKDSGKSRDELLARHANLE